LEEKERKKKKRKKKTLEGKENERRNE